MADDTSITPYSPRYRGTRILDVLREMERSQAWLARKMSVSPTLMCRVLQGRRSITDDFVARACAALNMPPEKLFILPETMLMSMSTEPDSPFPDIPALMSA